MGMTGADSLFVDTNVLVYAAVVSSPFHSAAISALRQHRAAGRPLWISTQVIREFLSVLGNPNITRGALDARQAETAVRFFHRKFAVAEDTTAVSRTLARLLRQIAVARRRVHDANIVATCLVYAVPALLTHNTTDFVPFSPHLKVEPLVAAGKT